MARPQTFADHVDYLLEKVGDEHIGVGLDYVFDMEELNDYVAEHPDVFPPEKGYRAGLDFMGPDKLPEVVQIFGERGYSDATIGKIMGLNLVRVAKEVWA